MEKFSFELNVELVEPLKKGFVYLPNKVELEALLAECQCRPAIIAQFQSSPKALELKSRNKIKQINVFSLSASNRQLNLYARVFAIPVKYAAVAGDVFPRIQPEILQNIELLMKERSQYWLISMNVVFDMDTEETSIDLIRSV
jgi:hypothetical protein